MKITLYGTELDEYGHSFLVEKSNYDFEEQDRVQLYSPSLITKMFNEVFRLNKQTEEYVYMLALNTKCVPLGVFEISHGIVNSSVYSAREIFIKALLCNASGIVLIHNHPSMFWNPSKQDIEMTKKIKKAGEILGIGLLDSIIVGDGYYSFKESDSL